MFTLGERRDISPFSIARKRVNSRRERSGWFSAYAEAQVKAAEPPLTYCVPLGRVISGGDDDRTEIDRFIATASGLVEDMYSE